MKLTKVFFAAAMVSVLATSTAFAGTWKQGDGENQEKWWYDNEDGTYAKDGWQWLDKDGDGVDECYYFDADGWMLVNTTTPDGHMVNADGAWTENGVIQTQNQEAQDQTQQNTDGQYLTGSYGADGVWVDKLEDKESWDGSIYQISYVEAAYRRYSSWASEKGSSMEWPENFWENYATIDQWAQEDSTGEGAAWKAQIEKYQIPMTLYENRIGNSSNGRGGDITFRSQPGTEHAKYDIWSTIVFVLWKKTDGMAVIADLNGNEYWTDSAQFMTINEDGSVTYTFSTYMRG